MYAFKGTPEGYQDHLIFKNDVAFSCLPGHRDCQAAGC